MPAVAYKHLRVARGRGVTVFLSTTVTAMAMHCNKMMYISFYVSNAQMLRDSIWYILVANLLVWRIQ